MTTPTTLLTCVPYYYYNIKFNIYTEGNNVTKVGKRVKKEGNKYFILEE